MQSTTESIAAFLAGAPHAVVGASSDRGKFGNRVLRCYQRAGRAVYAVNPVGSNIENCPTVASLSQLPEAVHGISIITQPAISEAVVAEALELGIAHIWLQPGAESPRAMELARAAGANLIAGGPCLLIELGC